MEAFNTREIAVGFWLFIFAVWGLSRADVRARIGPLIRAAMKPKLLIPVLFAAVATASVAAFLHRYSLWTVEELKDTIIWFLFTGIAVIFRGVSKGDPNRVLGRIFWDTLKITAVVEFLLNTYTFPLWVEFLLFPFMAGVAMLGAVAGFDAKFSSIASVLRGIQIIIGLTVLACTLNVFFHHTDKMWTMQSARELFLPIALSAAFIPIAFVIAVLSAYEQLFLQLNIAEKPFVLKTYAKLKFFIALKLNPRRIVVAQRRVGFRLGKANTRQDINEMIDGLSTDIPAPVPATVDRAAYLAGYNAGAASKAVAWDQREAMHRRCDAEIEQNHYDQESFDEGFVAGSQDAELTGDNANV